MSWLDDARATAGGSLFGPSSGLGIPAAAALHPAADGSDWKPMPRGLVRRQAGDPHQTCSTSSACTPARSSSRSATRESLEPLFNRLNLKGLAGSLSAHSAPRCSSARDLLATLGYTGADRRPTSLDKFFSANTTCSRGRLVDDKPLSESEAIRPATDGGPNYLQWLIEAANTSLDALYAQQGFVDDAPPTALLYSAAPRPSARLPRHERAAARSLRSAVAASGAAGEARCAVPAHPEPHR